MIEKHRALLLTISFLLLFISNVSARNSEILLGEDDYWSTVSTINLSMIEGKRGYYDLTNSDNHHQIDKNSDLILSFNNPSQFDKTGHYELDNSISLAANKNTFGQAAFFDGENTLIIKPVEESLFSAANLWGDFTLEFRLYPATLKEGSTIFLWKGLQMIDNQLIPQEIRCTVTNRRLVWDFENFFLYPDDTISRVSLSGDQLIPENWSHHMVLFDSETGLLEYRINNVPNDNTYTSKSGRETSEFNIPLIGNQQSFPIELGENYSGLIDEFRISRSMETEPMLNKYSSVGFFETDIIDLKIPESLLIQIDSQRELPINTSIYMEYAISNKKDEISGPSLIWKQFLPHEPINEKGQYIKIRGQLFSEPHSNNAPVLSNLKIQYREAPLPQPPINVSVMRNHDSLTIHWDKSIDPSIDGYMVYFGESPGNYLTLGSPIDAGQKNSIIVSNLNLNKRYYFAVTSYRSGDTRLESRFSKEISFSP